MPCCVGWVARCGTWDLELRHMWFMQRFLCCPRLWLTHRGTQFVYKTPQIYVNTAKTRILPSVWQQPKVSWTIGPQPASEHKIFYMFFYWLGDDVIWNWNTQEVWCDKGVLDSAYVATLAQRPRGERRDAVSYSPLGSIPNLQTNTDFRKDLQKKSQLESTVLYNVHRPT